MSGWIKVHRNITNSWLWNEKPFDKRSAWIDMILMANHKDNKFLLGNQLLEVKRGSFITSESKLAERWGWSRTKVRDFLDLLESDQMVKKVSDSKKTTVFIENYSKWQNDETAERPDENNGKQAFDDTDPENATNQKTSTNIDKYNKTKVSETTEKPQKNRKKTAKKHQEDTNNNDKECIRMKRDISDRTYPLIFETWNSLEVTRLGAITPGTKRHNALDSLVEEFGLDVVLEAIGLISESDYLTGKVNGEKIKFDWFIEKDNFIKVMEGRYKNKDQAKLKTSGYRTEEELRGLGLKL